MSRPLKNGVDYWPFDVGIFEDKKFRLLKGEFGALGVLTALYLLNEVYKCNGYYKKWDEDDYILMSETVSSGCTPELVRRILTKCCSSGLFDKTLFETHSVLSSRGIQRRYLRMLGGHRDKVYITEEYMLIDLSEESELSAGTLKKIVLRSLDGTKTEVSVPKTEDNPRENYTKQSKANKSKENKSKANESTAKQSISDELICDESCAAPSRLTDSFSAIKEPSSKDIAELARLADKFGELAVLDAIEDTARKGGRSVAYVSAVLADNASSPPSYERRYQPRQPAQPKYTYPPTCDYAALEDEFWEELAMSI